MSQLQSIVNDSILESFEKEVLLSALQNMEEGDQEDLAEIFTQKPELVPIMYLNLVAKTIATSTEDGELFKKILKQEMELLSSLE